MTYAGSKVYVKASRFPGQVDQWSARACPPFPSMGTLAAQKIFCPPVSMDVLRAKHGPGAFGTVHVFCGKQKRFIFFWTVRMWFSVADVRFWPGYSSQLLLFMNHYIFNHDSYIYSLSFINYS